MWGAVVGQARASSEVADALALGSCTTVLDLLASDEGAATDEDTLTGEARRLARATCLLREGEAARALSVLPEQGELAGYAALLAGEALIGLGRPEEALVRLEGVSLPGRAGQQVRLMRGRLLAPYGDGAGRRDLEGLLGTELGPQARYWLAEARGVGGDVVGMEALLREVWSDARPGGWDVRAARRLGELGAPVGGLDTPTQRELAETRLQQLQRYRRTDLAQALADRLYAGEAPTDREGQMFLGRVYYAARAYPKALEAWRLALGPAEEAAGSAEELFDYALCHARTDDYHTAAVVYQRLVSAHPETQQADFGSFKLGYMKYDRNECDGAVALFAAHRDRYPDSRYLDEALWFASRCLWRQERIDDAIELLEALRAKRPRSSLVPGAAYWQSRALGMAGDADAEVQGLEAVLDAWPDSGYAWFAAERLGREFPPRPQALAPTYPAAWNGRSAVRHSQALLDVGLRSFALDELDTLPAPTNRASALALAWARLRAGDYRAAQRLACGYAAPAWQTGDPVAQQACVPRPENGIVTRHASAYGLDPAVAFGVMWAESALDPLATSAVGARGLMQLMPDVGGMLHAELYPQRAYNADDLYLAPYNAALGTTELGQRMGSLQGTLAPDSVPAVIASYNAGEDVVRRWLDDGPTPHGAETQPAFDAWTEDISYNETRTYVKRVLGHVMAYRWLYGDARSN